MNARNVNSAVVVVAVLAAVGVVLIVGEIVQGSRNPTPAIANPCARRAPFPGSGFDATVQRVVLDGLDGAACRLGTSRERLLLALAGDSSQRLPRSRKAVEAAVRAGLLRSLDEATERGDIPALLAPLLRRVVQAAPLEQLIQGAVGLRGLFG